MIALDNLESDLENGLFSKLKVKDNPNRIVIGNNEIISERDKRRVRCHPGTVVNNYVPFYFSVRTPMLYNIHTGHGTQEINQRNIVYLCIPILDLTNENFIWCFTDGNAAKRISHYFTNLGDLNKIDWKSITSNDFRFDNADGDEDRIRKKHSEFLVKDYVPSNKIKGIAVYNNDIKSSVEAILKKLKININVKVKTDFYFQ